MRKVFKNTTYKNTKKNVSAGSFFLTYLVYHGIRVVKVSMFFLRTNE